MKTDSVVRRWAAMTRDLYLALGEFTEDMAFVTREVGTNDVTYYILTGGETHGHHLRIRFQGARVARVLERFRSIQAERRAPK
jgi:hypothetical protein